MNEKQDELINAQAKVGSALADLQNLRDQIFHTVTNMRRGANLVAYTQAQAEQQLKVPAPYSVEECKDAYKALTNTLLAVHSMVSDQIFVGRKTRKYLNNAVSSVLKAPAIQAAAPYSGALKSLAERYEALRDVANEEFSRVASAIEDLNSQLDALMEAAQLLQEESLEKDIQIKEALQSKQVSMNRLTNCENELLGARNQLQALNSYHRYVMVFLANQMQVNPIGMLNEEITTDNLFTSVTILIALGFDPVAIKRGPEWSKLLSVSLVDRSLAQRLEALAFATDNLDGDNIAPASRKWAAMFSAIKDYSDVSASELSAVLAVAMLYDHLWRTKSRLNKGLATTAVFERINHRRFRKMIESSYNEILEYHGKRIPDFVRADQQLSRVLAGMTFPWISSDIRLDNQTDGGISFLSQLVSR